MRRLLEWEVEELEDQLNDVLMSFSLLREEPGIKEDIKGELLEAIIRFMNKGVEGNAERR